MGKKDNRVLLPVLFMFLFTFPLAGDTGDKAVIPGDVTQISYYTNFFYNLPSEDFFYHLNERLLYMEKPDDRIMGSGLRNKLLRIVRWHNIIKKALRRYKRDKNNMIAINVTTPDGYKQALVILNLLGLRLEKTPGNQFRVAREPASGFSDYFLFTLLKAKIIENQINKTNHFYFKLKEDRIPVPWRFAFLRLVTGLEIDSNTFFETLLKDERFSLLLGVLYRLSDREIDYISRLAKSVPYAAWKQVYQDKQFLMGMFILSGALRVTGDEKVRWMLPGGKGAEAFWNELAGKDCRTSPLEFLYQLATKDDGKLNYLYLFASFLPLETQKTLFTGPNAREMAALYHRVSLANKEKLNQDQFPGLRDFNFYTLLYALQMKDRGFHFPQGVEPWLKIITAAGGEKTKPDKLEEMETKDIQRTVLEKTYAPTAARKKAFYSRTRSGYYVRISGGPGFLDGGDFKTMMDINEPFFSHIDNPSTTSKSPFFMSFLAEVGYSLGQFSIGLETGRITKTFTVLDPINYLYRNTGEHSQSLSALPLLLNCHFKLLETSFLDFSIFGGGGIYFGRFKQRIKFRVLSLVITEPLPEVLANITESSTQAAPGFHLGASLEFFISKKLAFFVEGRYRLVDFNHLQGKGRSVYRNFSRGLQGKYNGDLNYNAGDGTSPAGFYIGDFNFPGFSDDLRKAKFNLVGFSLTVGGKFYF